MVKTNRWTGVKETYVKLGVIYILCLSCFRVCSLLHWDNLKGKGWPLGTCLNVMFIVILLLSHFVSLDRCGTWLYRFLILAVFLIFIYVSCSSFFFVCWERAGVLALVCDVFLSLSHVVAWVRCGTWLCRFLIFAVFLILLYKVNRGVFHRASFLLHFVASLYS